VQPDRVTVGETASFGCVLMKDFFKALVKKVERNTTSFDNFLRMYVPPGNPLKQREGEPIKVLTLYKHIQVLLTFAFCRPKKSIFWANYYSSALDNFSRV
jgi:pyruvate decarboxylase